MSPSSPADHHFPRPVHDFHLDVVDAPPYFLQLEARTAYRPHLAVEIRAYQVARLQSRLQSHRDVQEAFDVP
jgi:hypothetical protein